MATTTAAVPETPKNIGAVGRVIGAIFSPRPTFEDIARKPSWLMPVVLQIIFFLAVTAVFTHRVGWEAFMEKQISQNPRAQQRMEQVPPEQRAGIMATQAKVAEVIGFVSPFIFVPIVLLVMSGILMGLLNATSGAELSFKTSFGIVSHAYMPTVVGGILGLIALYARPPDQIDIQNLVASNVGAFLSSDAPRWLQSLGISLDIFTFWCLALLGFGFAVARPKKVTFGKAFGWAVIIWAVYVIVKVGLTAAFA